MGPTKSILCRLILTSIIIVGGAFYSKSSAQLSYRDTIFKWNHFEYSLDENNGMASYSTTNIIEDEYQGIVLENEFIRLVVLPDFGARIISYYYKPSNHEQFYTNRVGTPYGMGDGNFYYDWLMVMGGVFPTFPEPEHGKTWFSTWQWEFLEISDERISLQMQIMDTINYPYHPGKFNNGLTEIRCITVVSLQKGKTSFELNHTIENTKGVTTPFEYWTCTTLAPGSEPGNTYTPKTSEIIAPIDYIYVKDDWWSWMGYVEEPASGQGSHVFEYDNLAIYENWEDMGIGYAHPYIDENYYGVINHENEEGVFRVSNNAEITPGMKFWTWGADQGLSADPEDFNDIARPYIELWSGISTQFFEDAQLLPDESITWTETYLLSMGMESASYVNKNGAVFLEHVNGDMEHFNTKIFTATPNQTFNLNVSLQGFSAVNLYEGDFISSSENCTSYTYFIDDYSIEDGDYILNAIIKDQSGIIVLESSIPVTVPFPPDGISIPNKSIPKLLQISNNTYKIEFKDLSQKELAIYSMEGKLITMKKIYDSSTFITVDKPGLYIIRISEKNYFYSFKILF